MDQFETPLGNLKVDIETTAELARSGMFNYVKRESEENEHSLEMQLPYIKKVFQGHDVSIVPIIVGDLSKESERAYGKLLAPYLTDPKTLFIISSDFCHWGERFNYTPQTTPDKSDTVKYLDEGGMKEIA